MALETGSVANLKFQQTIANAQAECAAERELRVKAEAKAAAADERANRLAKEVSKLERQLEAKNRRVSSLEGALQQREVSTPADHKALGQALNAVGDLVSQLDDSPEEVVVRKLNHNVGRKRGRAKVAEVRVGNGRSMNLDDDSPDDSDDDPTYNIAAPTVPAAQMKKKSKAKTKAKKGRLSNADEFGMAKQELEHDKENKENKVAATSAYLPPLPSLSLSNKSTEPAEHNDLGQLKNNPPINNNNGGKRRLLGVSTAVGNNVMSSNALSTSQLLFRPPKL
jgi:hypothetical protein